MKKILIVEDEMIMRKLLVDAFTKNGFKVAEASDGEEGLKVALDFKPDTILLDLMMPGMDGLVVLKKLKEEEWSKDIPVTILTNSGESDKIAKALEQGVSKYIIKSSMAVDDIVERIAKELK